MSLRWLCAIAAVLVCLATPAHAFAWTEWHEHENQVRIEVAREGQAQVTHRLRYRVVMGPLKSVDLPGVPAAAALDANAEVLADDGASASPAAAAFLPADPKDPGTTRSARVTLGDPKGLKRGKYTIVIRYALPTSALLERDGSLVRLRWSQPPSPEGADSAKIVFVVPTAPMEPRLASEGGTWLVHQTRGASSDEIELERPHVAKGEAATAAVRIDPRALDVAAPLAAKPLPPQQEAPENRVPLLALGLFGLAVAAAGAWSMRVHSARSGLVAPAWLSATFGLALGCGALAACRAELVVQSGALALATLVAAVRAPARSASGGASQRWVPLREADAYTIPRRGLPFAAHRFGKTLRIAATASLFLGAGYGVDYMVGADAGLAVLAFGAPVLVLVAMDGPRGIAARRQRKLRELAERIGAAASGVRVVPIAPAFAVGDVAELRLRLVPRAPLPGLAAIELGFAADATQLAFVLRAREGTAAERRIRALVPGAAGPGRAEGERAVVLEPKVPLTQAVCELGAFVARALQERRQAPVLFRGRDRRAAGLPLRAA